MSTSRRAKLANQRAHKRTAEEKRLAELLMPRSSNLGDTRGAKMPEPKKYVRETAETPSLKATGKPSTQRRASAQYTGDYIIGLATTHKSNIVPVCKDEDPIAYAQMRRS